MRLGKILLALTDLALQEALQWTVFGEDAAQLSKTKEIPVWHQ